MKTEGKHVVFLSFSILFFSAVILNAKWVEIKNKNGSYSERWLDEKTGKVIYPTESYFKQLYEQGKSANTLDTTKSSKASPPTWPRRLYWITMMGTGDDRKPISNINKINYNTTEMAYMFEESEEVVQWPSVIQYVPRICAIDCYSECTHVGTRSTSNYVKFIYTLQYSSVFFCATTENTSNNNRGIPWIFSHRIYLNNPAPVFNNSFSSNGLFLFTNTKPKTFFSQDLLSNGSVSLLGYFLDSSNNNIKKFVMPRLLSNGSFDLSFGTNGFLYLDDIPTTNLSSGYNQTIKEDNSVIVFGETNL